MKHMTRRRLSLSVLTALIAVFVAAPSGFAQTPPTAPPATIQSLSDAQFRKINGWIADQGRAIAVDAMITDILGLTRGDATMSCRAFAAVGDGNEIHQIYMLPEGRGYLDAHFYQDKIDVYYTDKNFVLIAALNGVRGEKPAPASFADAQYGFGVELAWWAKYTDTH